ncbi:MAG: hypothetical protein Q8L27_01005 [archaeon]|nr:hypothetical protein [archaeon]
MTVKNNYERLSVIDISRKYDISKSMAGDYVLNTREMLADAYKNHTAKEVAEIYGVSESAVRYAAKKVGIKKDVTLTQFKKASSRLEEKDEQEWLNWHNKGIEGNNFSKNLETIAEVQNLESNKPGFFRKFGKYAALATGTIAAVALMSCGKAPKYEEPKSPSLSEAYLKSNSVSTLLVKTDELQRRVNEVKILTHELKEDVVAKYFNDSTNVAEQTGVGLPNPFTLNSFSSVDFVSKTKDIMPRAKILKILNEKNTNSVPVEVISNDLGEKIGEISLCDNLDAAVKSDIDASKNSVGNLYGELKVGAVGDCNILAEFGYKTVNWGLGASIDNTAFQLKYGLFDKTDSKVDLTVSAILGDKSGVGIMFGKDNVFGENNDWNFRYAAGLGAVDGFVVSGNAALIKKLNDSWNMGLEARVNVGNNSSAGGLLTLSCGNRTFEDAMPGFDGAGKKDSGNGSDVDTNIVQPTNTQNDNDGTTPVNPIPQPVNPPAEDDGTGGSDLR